MPICPLPSTVSHLQTVHARPRLDNREYHGNLWKHPNLSMLWSMKGIHHWSVLGVTLSYHSLIIDWLFSNIKGQFKTTVSTSLTAAEHNHMIKIRRTRSVLSDQGAPEYLEKFINLWVSREEWSLVHHLSKYTSNRPHIYWSWIVAGAK